MAHGCALKRRTDRRLPAQNTALLDEYFYNHLGKSGLVLRPSFVEAVPVDDKRFAHFPKAKDIADAYRGTVQFRLKSPEHWDFRSIYAGAETEAAQPPASQTSAV